MNTRSAEEAAHRRVIDDASHALPRRQTMHAVLTIPSSTCRALSFCSLSTTEALQAFGNGSESGFPDSVWFLLKMPNDLPDELKPRSLSARFGLSQECLDAILLDGGIGPKASPNTWLRKITEATGQEPRQVFLSRDYTSAYSSTIRLR